MKDKVFRDWVMTTLIVINVLLVFFMASDFGSLWVFFITHTVALLIFVINTILLIKYGKNIFE